MYFDYSVIKKRKLYPFLVPVLRLLSHIIYSTKCVGAENIPDDGKLIIACNHIAFSDPAFIIAYSTRRVHFMAKSELFENYFVAKLLANMNAFPVRRNTSDRKSLLYAKKVLDSDWILGIFPEGRRIRGGSSPTEGKTGIAFLSRMCGADVLPACIYKTNERRLRPKVTVKFGKVIKNSDLGFDNADRNEELKAATDKIMRNIKLLWEEENANRSS